MGQKVNPNGLRVGVIKNWDSRWFAKDNVFGDLLVEDYEIGKTLAFHHFDFYRFESAEEFDEAGFRELFGPGMVTACEWSEKAAPYLPDADLEISLRVKDLSRDASLKAYTPLGRVVLMEVCA